MYILIHCTMYYAMIIIIKVTTADVRTFPTQYNTSPLPT